MLVAKLWKFLSEQFLQRSRAQFKSDIKNDFRDVYLKILDTK